MEGLEAENTAERYCRQEAESNGRMSGSEVSVVEMVESNVDGMALLLAHWRMAFGDSQEGGTGQHLTWGPTAAGEMDAAAGVSSADW